MSDRVIDLDGGRYSPALRSVLTDAGSVRLSATEARLLDFFLAHVGEHLSSELLLREVWGHREGVESRTAYTTVHRLRQKIERDPNKPVHVLGERGGYRFELRAAAIEDPRSVGRDGERAALERLIEAHRLVTVVGPGGTGKTHLVTSLLATSSSRLAVGARLVYADVFRDAEGLAGHVLAALGVPNTGKPRIHAGRALRELGRSLVILDNLEQVEGAGELLAEWLEQAPLLVLLVTSRAPVRIRAEHVYALAPLPLPAPGAASPNDPAIRLFELRARHAAPEFRAEIAGLEAVAEVVRAVDGLPLAIELAAARLGTLPLSALRNGLPRRIDLLASQGADTPDRQTSVHRTLEWSWRLLDADEQHVLPRLSVFAGGFTLAAAIAVCHGATIGPVERALGGLVDKSLVRAHRAASGDIRYDLLMTVAAWAGERLVSDPVVAAESRRRHATWFGSLVPPGA